MDYHVKNTVTELMCDISKMVNLKKCQNLSRYGDGEAWLDHGMTSMAEPWYHDQFCRRTSILVNLNNSPEVDKWLSKRGRRTNIL